MLAARSAAILGPPALAALHARELPQKDNLCGCFWGALALRAWDIEQLDGVPVDQDLLAAESGTTLPPGDPARAVPPSEASRRDYRAPLPVAREPRAAGTSARALARAVERLAGGRLAVVPVAGPWSAHTVVALAEAAAEHAPRAVLVANVRTGLLWGSRPHPSALLAALAGAAGGGPPPEWDVGHFVNVAAVVRAAGGALVVVRDSYRSLGWDGHHVQPAAVLARALERGDGSEGGVLCICSAVDEAALRAALGAAALELRHWDNGTPGPAEPAR